MSRVLTSIEKDALDEELNDRDIKILMKMDSDSDEAGNEVMCWVGTIGDHGNNRPVTIRLYADNFLDVTKDNGDGEVGDWLAT